LFPPELHDLGAVARRRRPARRDRAAKQPPPSSADGHDLDVRLTGVAERTCAGAGCAPNLLRSNVDIM